MPDQSGQLVQAHHAALGGLEMPNGVRQGLELAVADLVGAGVQQFLVWIRLGDGSCRWERATAAVVRSPKIGRREIRLLGSWDRTLLCSLSLFSAKYVHCTCRGGSQRPTC
jgi:hypothetical protein